MVKGPFEVVGSAGTGGGALVAVHSSGPTSKLVALS